MSIVIKVKSIEEVCIYQMTSDSEAHFLKHCISIQNEPIPIKSEGKITKTDCLESLSGKERKIVKFLESPDNNVLKSKEGQIMNFLDRLNDLFPKKNIKDYNFDDKDVISKEQSDLRIIWFLNILSICSTLTVICEIIAIGIAVIPHEPRIVQPVSKHLEQNR